MLVLVAMILAQSQTTTCRQVYDQSVCTTQMPPASPPAPTGVAVDGYAGALGPAYNYNDEQLKRRQAQALEAAAKASDQASDRVAECAAIARDILKAGQPDIADRLLRFCAE